MKEYNENGQLTKEAFKDGYWYTFEYNDKGEEVRFEKSNGLLVY
jgi:hypothetical protein